VSDVDHYNTVNRFLDSVDNAPITDPESEQVGKVSLQSLDIVMLSRFRAKEGKTPIKSAL
jgi:hypothetical protein